MITGTQRKNVEDIYRLSPVQQGMLLHSLLAPGTGVYFEQFRLRYGAGFDPARFEETWRRVVRRHPVLRTAFVWEDLEEPVQVVYREVELPIERQDWRALPPEEQEERYRELLAEDRRNGFRLDRPPLLRLTIVRVGDDDYRVAWSYHHLLLDGWSTGLLMREVFELYQGLATGIEPPLPERRPFRDYVRWLRGQDLTEAREYWRQRLEGLGEPTPLGVDRPAAGSEDSGYELTVRMLPRDVTARLKTFAQENRLTLNTLVQAAYALLLARYSGRDDVVFGVTLSGRPPALRGVDTMIGCFINTLPFRVRVDPDAEVLPWLQAVQADQSGLRKYEHSPLVEVQRVAEVGRDRELFESILVFESFTADAAFEMSHSGVYQRTNYPLTLVAAPGEQMVLRAGFEAARFDAATVERLLGHLATLLEALAESSDRRVRDLSPVDPAERRQALTGWNRPEADFRTGRAVHQLFAEHAALRPDRVALTFEDRAVTYGALAAAAARLARRLAREGAGRGTRIGLCVDRSVEMVVGILGILEAGGAYVPMDPAAPEERLRFIVEDSGAPLVVTTEAQAGALPATARRVLVAGLDAEGAEGAEGAAGASADDGAGPGAPVAPDELAYVIYTSGSTGRPKGSLVRHGSVQRLLDATDEWFAFGPEDAWTLFHSYAFDFSVWELWGALAYGGRVAVVPYWVSRSPEAFHDLLRRERITVLDQTPSAFKQLVAADAAAGLPPGELALRTVIFGGEALEPSSLAPWFARHGDRHPRLVNMYGITETTVHVTYRPMTEADLKGGGGSPVGVPIPDLQVHLLDPWMNLVPEGVPGEIHVGGEGLAQGYLGRPALTAERFVPDPFAAEAGVPQPAGRRLYKAGDLARRLPGGELDFLGRIDQQVKIRGFRIELGEIEAVLARHPDLARTAVVAREDVPGERRLVAYVVPRPGTEPSLEELRDHAGRFLPDYMVPAAFVAIDELPLTVNGKLDRRALPAPEESERMGPDAEFRPPATPTETSLAEIWAEVLRVERVGRDDGFFDLGGHSLLATRVVSRVKAALEIDLPLAVLFDAATLADMAATIDGLRASRTGSEEPIPRISRDDALPLSHAQERLWFLDRFEPESPLYNLPSGFLVHGRLSAARLASALGGLTRRHETLRTTFAETADGPVQVIHEPSVPALPVIDLRGLPPARRQDAAKRAARTEVRRPFDLLTGPLLRATLVRLDADRHLVLLTLHHAITDGTSEGVLVRDLLAFYSGPETARALPELPVRYADFAAWQRRRLAGELLAAEVEHWRSRLAGAPPRIELPSDRPRPPAQTFRGGTLGARLPAAVAGDLREVARRHEATPFMVALAAYAALLARHSGQDEVVVGTPVEGRLRPEVEEVVGFFVNTLPLRVPVPAGAPFGELVARARTVTVEAQEHQEVPFERLVEEIAPERNLAYTPLFQVMLTLQATAARPAPPPGLDLALTGEAVAPATGISKFDLTLSLFDTGTEMVGHWAYSVDLFDAATVDRFGRHLEILLAAGCADPATPVGALPVLSASELHQVLREWNAPALDHPADGFVHEMVAVQAAESPDRVAVVFDGGSEDRPPAAEVRISYGELDRRSAILAGRLRGSGVGPESRVGVFAERSPGLVSALLAVLRAGAAYVPLDPALPADRLRYMAEDAGLRTLLVSKAAEPRARELFTAADLLVLPDGGSTDRAGALAPPALLPDNAAYVLYTSGSTGRPKGVVISHRALGNRLQYARTADVGTADGFLQKTTISFDVSVAELFGPLVAGGRTVLPAPGGEKDTAYLVDLIARERVTLTSFPPTLLYGLLEEEGFRRLDSLRVVVTGGETVPAELPDRFYRHLSGAVLMNRYGPTETTVSVTSWPCPPGDESHAVPIGRPTARAEVLLLDRELRPVPMGVAGEVVLGGPGVARGYLHRPARTAEAFVPHPWSDRPGERVYRSGDLARVRPDGAFEFAGRIDTQVKIRGFRVELGEIEAILVGHPSVREAVVVARGEGAAKVPVAYVVLEAGARVDEAELATAAAEALPPYMVPVSITVMESLPLTPTGKVDRRALPEPSGGEADPAEGAAAPRGAVEEVVAAIWADLLGRAEVGRDQDFFDLGGHSLLATRVVSRLRAAFGVELPLRRLFEQPTVAGLAGSVAALRAASSAAGAVPPLDRLPRAADGTAEAPLSFAQERLWFLDRMDEGPAAYNMLSAIRLHGDLDPVALHWSLGELVRRHETLRTRFRTSDGVPVQQILPWRSPDLPVIDLSGLARPERERETAALLRGEERRRFDLAQGPLFRPLLVRGGDRENVFLATLHHVISDAWSLGVFVRELGALYRGSVEGADGRLPELPVQYADFSAWQREWLQGEVLEAQVAYWRSRLAGAKPVLDLPTDRPRPAVQSARGEVLSLRLSRELTDRLRELAHRRGGTLFMALMAGFQALLERYSGQGDLTVGTTIANRSRAELEDLVGFFVNALALRGDLSDDPTFERLLERVRDESLGAYDHQDLPFEKLVQELQPERDLSRSPLFQVLLQLQNAPVERLDLPGLVLAPVTRESANAKFDLILNFFEGEGLFAQWRYRTDLFDRTTVRRMSRHLVSLLTAAAADPARPVSHLPLLDPAERHHMVHEIAGGSEDHPVGGTLDGVFRERAAQVPEAVAATCAAASLSYGELDRRSEALARRLLAAGVRPGAPVALLLDRSLDLVVAVVGVLRAGAAYLPLDPAYPAERLAFMLEDSGAPVVVSRNCLASDLPEVTGLERLLLDADPEPREDAAAPAAASGGGPEDLAYVIYTSGSTGRPKGVPVRHGNVLRLFTATDRWFRFGADDAWTLFHSYAFDFSVWELWGALLHGGRLVVVPQEVSRSPADFHRLLARERVTFLNQTPSAFRQLVRADAGAEALASLRTVVFGGEALELASLAPWFARYGDRRPTLVNMYGITETTVHVTYRPIGSRDLAVAPGSVIGRSIPDLSCQVMDRHLQPVPSSVAGEILVGGAGLAPGYLGRPRLTAERFVPDPVGSMAAGGAGARLYRSGDLARRRATGDLEYLGRIDHQVKVRGFRIELGEIESALVAHPGVAEAVVLAGDGAGAEGEERRLVGYVVAAGGTAAAELTVAELRRFVAERLPEYMVPAAFVTLDAIPLTPNGKVDRRSLPRPDGGRLDLGTGYVAPRDDLERRLAEIWERVLGLDRVGVEDDFFDLGGNSLVGVTLIDRLQEALGEIVHVVVLFDAPSVARLAEHLRGQHPEGVARWTGTRPAAAGAGEEAVRPVDGEMAGRVRTLIRTMDRFTVGPPAEGPKNPPAVFVLSAPRSGSTLLRVMLGGHPGLFAPPELELLSFDTLAERRRAFQGRDAFWLEGAIRAVMELEGSDAEAANERIAAFEDEGWSTLRFYRWLQERMGGRLLVDKTPSYTLREDVLARAESGFDGARYIHLVRHPYGMVHSFEEAKLDQIFFPAEHPFSRRQLAELIWLVSEENVRGFLATVPEERWTRVRYEDLVAEPVRELRRVCRDLDLEYHPAMAEPYADRKSRMTDGVHASSRMLGDVKFHRHAGIDEASARRWREAYDEDFWGAPTRELAEALGYEPIAAGAAPRIPLEPVPRRPGETAPASFNQERLWFLDHLDPGSPTYSIPASFRLRGALDTAAFDRAVVELARRHETLRTSLVLVGDRPVQAIDPEPRLRLAQVDLAGLPGARREVAAERVKRQARAGAFELGRGPLARLVLVRLAPEEHELTLVLHHVIADGWSLGVALREVATLYGAFRSGSPSPLPALPIQYADYAVWQRRWLQGETLDRQLAYWRENLSGVEPLELPTDRPRPRHQSFRGGTRTALLPAGLEADLEELRRSEGATPFMVLLAAYAAALGRASGQDGFAVGTPVANRSRARTEGLIGLLINTVALRVGLGGEPTFRDLLARVRGTTLGAFAHQELPFERVVEEIYPERDLSRSPIYQVLLTMAVEREQAGLELPGLEVEGRFTGATTAKFDLSVAVTRGGAGAGGDRPLLDAVTIWMYNRDLFDATTVERLARHFTRLLAEALRHPDLPLSQLPWLSPAERQQLLEWNDTGTRRTDTTLPELIRDRAARCPDAVAVTFEERSLSYGALWRQARGVGERLRRAGAGPEALIGISMERSLELVVGLVGILEAGAAYVPVDPSYPAERRAFMLADSGVAVVLVQDHLRREVAELAPDGVEVLALGAPAPSFTGPDPVAPAEARGRTAGADGAAYAIYTSGSTGRPKGAVNSHRAIVNRLLWMQETYGLEGGDRVLQKTPVSFDVSVWELFWPLITGATLVMARPGGHQDPAYLVETIRAERITTLHFVPSMLQVFLGAPGVEECVSLRRVIASGEALPGPLVRRFYRMLPAPLHNLYGPTEAAIDVTYHATSPSEGASVPIGRPVANTGVHVLGRDLRRVAVGEVGELFLGGVQLARGYHRRPALTAERFVPEPRAQRPGGRLYRTGDLARFLSGGSVEFLGRTDHQVKLRGFRIELGEIEAALGSLPGVGEAVVTARPDARGDAGLVAYLVPLGDPPKVRDLKAGLAARLPDYMVPSAFVAVDALPLTPSGKVDRKRLPEPGGPALPTAGEAGEVVAPRTPLEELLVSSWRSLLEIDTVGVHQDFFALGGNSLVGAVFVNQLQRRLGEIVHVVALFDHPTVAGLADYLARVYPRSVVRILGEGAHGGLEESEGESAAALVDDSMVAALRRGIPSRALPRASGRKNPRAVFILGPPRSGTTLLRVMLAGHPELFAPPELDLLPYAGLADRREAFSGRDRFRLEGLTRAVMEARGCEAAEAEALLDELTAGGAATPAVYARLQEWIGGRMLVDKTPTYAWYPEALAAAEEWFDEPLYVHLVRHPYGMIASFEEARLHEIFFRWEDSFGPRQLAELLWIVSHQNVLRFFERVPEERRRRMDFESLVRDPEGELRQLCSFLGIEYRPTMADPYGEPAGRMTDGVHAESRMLGDVKFHQHRRIDPAVADRWRSRYDRDFLGPVAWRVAGELGLEDRVEDPVLPRGLVGLRRGGELPPLFLVHPVSGDVYFYRHLAAALDPELPVYGLEARGLDGEEPPLDSVEEMAEGYVNAILSLRPEGPYLLAGSSMGGVLVYQMARLMKARGREVAFLGLLDTVHPAEMKNDLGSGHAAEASLLRFLTGGADDVPEEELARLDDESRLDRILERAHAASQALPPGLDRERLRRLVGVLRANGRALSAYRPPAHSGRAVFFRAAELPPGRTQPPDVRWRPLLQDGLQVVAVPGAHLSMHFPPHVAVLARRLQQALDEALEHAGVEAGRGPGSGLAPATT